MSKRVTSKTRSKFSIWEKKIGKLYYFFNDTATTEIYTLSLHDALPISAGKPRSWRTRPSPPRPPARGRSRPPPAPGDRKSTRLNSSHVEISYAVFCLKKKKKKKETRNEVQ